MVEAPTPGQTTAARKFVDEQYAFYKGEQRKYRLAFVGLRFGAIILAGLVSVLTALSAPAAVAIVLGAAVALIVGVEAVVNPRMNWVRFAVTAVQIGNEKAFFETGAEPYGQHANPAALLTERVGKLVNEETASWAKLMEQAKDAK